MKFSDYTCLVNGNTNPVAEEFFTKVLSEQLGAKLVCNPIGVR